MSLFLRLHFHSSIYFFLHNYIFFLNFLTACEVSVNLFFMHITMKSRLFCVAGKCFLWGTRAIRVGPLCVQSCSQECLHHGSQLWRAVFRWAGECFSFPLVPFYLPQTHRHTQKKHTRPQIHVNNTTYSHIPVSKKTYSLPHAHSQRFMYAKLHNNTLVHTNVHVRKNSLFTHRFQALVTSGRETTEWYCVKHGGTIKNK